MFASNYVSKLRIVNTTSYLDNCIALPGSEQSGLEQSGSEQSKQGLGLMRTFEISDRFSVNGLNRLNRLQSDGVSNDLRTKRSLKRQ